MSDNHTAPFVPDTVPAAISSSTDWAEDLGTAEWSPRAVSARRALARVALAAMVTTSLARADLVGPDPATGASTAVSGTVAESGRLIFLAEARRAALADLAEAEERRAALAEMEAQQVAVWEE